MDKQLLFSVTKKDFDITYFSGKGAGGQHRNKHKNCVRMKHKESGAISVGQSHRKRKYNLIEAFNNLVKQPKFRVWLNREAYELSETYKLEMIEIDKKVDKSMQSENLIVEYF